VFAALAILAVSAGGLEITGCSRPVPGDARPLESSDYSASLIIIFVPRGHRKKSCVTTSGDLTALTFAGQTTLWNHADYRQVTNKIDAAGVTNFVYQYDLLERITNLLDALGRITRYEYDPIGNLTKITYIGPSSTHSITYKYDGVNRLTNMVDAAGTTRFTYNDAGLITLEDGPWASDNVSYGYLNHLRSLMFFSGGNHTYTWDAAQRSKTVNSPAGTFTYDEAFIISSAPTGQPYTSPGQRPGKTARNQPEP
jgi:YD repeat-containing protein